MANDSDPNFEAPHQPKSANSNLLVSSEGQILSRGQPESLTIVQGATSSLNNASPSPPTLVSSETKSSEVPPDENPKTKTGVRNDATAKNEPKDTDEPPDNKSKTFSVLKIETETGKELGQDAPTSSAAQTASSAPSAVDAVQSSSADMSFMQVLDLRDVAAIDRNVARHVASTAKASLDIDDSQGDSMQEDEPDEIFEPDCEEFGFSEDVPADGGTTEARIKRVLEARIEHGLPKTRRLGDKSKPQGTNYPETQLVNKLEQKRLKSIEAESVKKKREIENASFEQARIGGGSDRHRCERSSPFARSSQLRKRGRRDAVLRFLRALAEKQRTPFQVGR